MTTRTTHLRSRARGHASTSRVSSSLPRPRARFGLCLLALAAGCDARADEDYKGSSLLHLEGRVTIDNPDAPENLIPALAFPDGLETTVVDVAVRGNFPNSFSLDVYAPPPPNVIATRQDEPSLPEGVEMALAYITAVPQDHPPTFELAGYTELLERSALRACVEEPACQRVERWCSDDTLNDCRMVGLPCADDEDCAPVVSAGNPKFIINEKSGAFAGLSEKNIVIWTRTGLPRSSLFSHLIGLDEDLPAGYSLIELGEPRENQKGDPEDGASEEGADEVLTPEAEAERECVEEGECDHLFQEEAFALYNAEHGTSYQSWEDIPFDDEQPELYDAIGDEIQALGQQLAVEHGYDVSAFVGTRLIRDPETKLHVRIAPDVDTLF